MQEQIHRNGTQYRIIKIDDHRVLIDQTTTNGDMGSKGTWVFDSRISHPTFLPDDVLSLIHVMLNRQETVWIVGDNQPDRDWTVVGGYSTETKAFEVGRTSEHYFIGPLVIDADPVHSHVDWDGAYYPSEIVSNVRNLDDVDLNAEPDENTVRMPIETGKVEINTEQLIDEIEEANGGGFIVSMDARKLVGDNYLGSKPIGRNEWPEAEKAANDLRVQSIQTLIRNQERKISEMVKFIREKQLLREYHDYASQETISPAEAVQYNADNWWAQFKTTEKAAIFRKYFSSGETTLMDLTLDDIVKMYVGELLK
jgi:hypothetical protein